MKRTKQNHYAIAAADGKRWSLVKRLLKADPVLAPRLEAALKLQRSAGWWIENRFASDPAAILRELEASPVPQPEPAPTPTPKVTSAVPAAVLNLDAIYVPCSSSWVN
jgi:hypothetical protein